MSPSISRAKYTALLLWPIRMSHRACQDDVGIFRVDGQVSDASGFFLPGLAGIGRFVNSLAHRDVTPNPRFAGSGPNDIRIGRRNRQRSD